MYANMMNMFMVIISGGCDYGDSYFLFAGLSLLQVAHVVFNTKYLKSKRRLRVQGTEGNWCGEV